VRIAIVGAVGSIISALQTQNYTIEVSEFDDELVNQDVAGVRIQPGACTPRMVENADLSIVTGMTISTDTLGDVLAAGRRGSTPIVFYAQTGAHILMSLDFPAPTVIVQEDFPHYMWPGSTPLSISRFPGTV
jgi:hypothetical protein